MARSTRPGAGGQAAGPSPPAATTSATTTATAGGAVAPGVPPAVAGVGMGALGAGLGLGLSGDAASGLGAAGGIFAVLIAMPRLEAPLRRRLEQLYAEAFLEGVKDACDYLGMPYPREIRRAVENPDKASSIAFILANPPEELQKILAKTPLVLGWVIHTLTARIARAIAEGRKQHQSLRQMWRAIRQAWENQEHMKLIADTEYQRAYRAGVEYVYVRSGVSWVEWVVMPGACELCLENEAVSPRRLGEPWPNGDVPVHPNCRCIEIPYHPTGDRDDLLL